MSAKIRTALLSKGYLPKELPPVFTSEDFGRFSGELIADWRDEKVFKVTKAGNVSRGIKKRDSYSYELKDTESEVLSSPKRTHDRRDINIVHPLPQLLISHEIANNWRSITKWVSKKKFSVDEIQVSSTFDRAVKPIDFSLHEKKKKYIESSSNWLLETDISRFYPSIYTHSIPWAAYGKERVKSNIKIFGGSFADRLDALVRSCNRNQTIGIPVGPETSRIIAEVISASIDDSVSLELAKIKGCQSDRLQDDWTIGLPTLDAAEFALSNIRVAYKKFGLDINGTKTHITRLVDRPMNDWTSEIRGYLLHKNGNLTGANLADFLNLCLKVQQIHPLSAVISYALAVIESINVRDYDVRAMESFLLRCAAVAPGSMDRICNAILDLQNRTESVAKDRVCNRLLELAISSAQQGFTFETIWSLYTIRGLRHRFDGRNLIAIDAVRNSSVIALLLLDIKERGSLVGTLPASEWSNFSKDQILNSPSWLLAYEGIRNGWLSDPNDLANTKLFKPMLDRNIIFYDKRRNMPTSKANLRKRLLRPSRFSSKPARKVENTRPPDLAALLAALQARPTGGDYY